jgi:Spy/CpxP family protein refolding chaperone
MNPQSRMQARLWLAIVFVLGVAIGLTFGFSFAHRSYASTTQPQMSEPERRAKRVAEMTSEIDLTAAQSQQVDAIIHEAHEQMKKVREKSDADLDAVRQKARGEMRELLTPQQKPKFEEFVRKMDEERKKQAGK